MAIGQDVWVRQNVLSAARAGGPLKYRLDSEIVAEVDRLDDTLRGAVDIAADVR